MSIEVDSLIFILSSQPPRLIPCKVVEQIVSKKSTGVSTTHMISTPSDKTYTLENLKQPWFPSLDEAEDYLINQAKQIVEKTIDRARKDSKDWFSQNDELDYNQEPEKDLFFEDVKLPENETTIMLENGIKARVIIPDELK